MEIFFYVKKHRKKFKRRFGGVLQFVTDFEDFQNIPIGACVSISSRENKSFGGYFEGAEKINENTQKVLIQYESEKVNFIPTQKAKKPFVAEYLFPISGEISVKDFKAIKKYKVE